MFWADGSILAKTFKIEGTGNGEKTEELFLAGR
jgi:hypothetical protein